MGLVACPFCREMFPAQEAKVCPVCGVALRNLSALSKSSGGDDEDGIPRAPELEPIPLTAMGRGKGEILGLALVGIALFFAPWIRVTLPEPGNLSGFDLARRMGWSWGALVAWLVLVPTVGSRRTILQLRGARVAAAFLAAVPAVTTLVLLGRTPYRRAMTVQFTFAWPLFATLAVSVAAVVVAAFRLGGRVDDIQVRKGSSSGQVLH